MASSGPRFILLFVKPNGALRLHTLLVYVSLLLATLAVASTACAQTPQAAPEPGYVLNQQTMTGRFIVQRWVNQASPEVSPSGMCECITVVYEGTRLVIKVPHDSGLVRVAATASDITGDRQPELVVTQYSGGAHCCESTAIYSVEAMLRPILSRATGNCSGELVDIDGNGSLEFRTCDDGFAYGFCSFAYSPMPTVVFAYDSGQRQFVRATPRYERALRPQAERALAEARKTIAESRNTDPETYRCAALGPALSLIYGGRVNDGLALFRQLYAGPDRMTLERQVMDIARKSPLWIER